MTMVLQRTYNSHTHSVHAATKTSFKNHNGVAVLRCCRFFQFALVCGGYSYNSIITETKNDWLNESETVKKESERKKLLHLVRHRWKTEREGERKKSD